MKLSNFVGIYIEVDLFIIFIVKVGGGPFSHRENSTELDDKILCVKHEKTQTNWSLNPDEHAEDHYHHQKN